MRERFDFVMILVVGAILTIVFWGVIDALGWLPASCIADPVSGYCQ